MLQGAANTDTKSSMGDKYETSREMTAIELEKLNGQKLQYLNQLKTLDQIKKTEPKYTVQLGSLVITSRGDYYLSLALGPVEVEEHSVIVISPNSPVGQLFLNKSVGTRLEFRGQSFVITGIL